MVLGTGGGAALLRPKRGQLLLLATQQGKGQQSFLAEHVAALQREEQLPSQELEEKELTSSSS